ncbi:hypothetical protein [Xanthomonas maliensis]|uniref:hypothetical protein n=1 Tax=Xanthomonas maliensis TaxID=1321368 RepID=UPI001265A008|nr:hypothetical protein [Xanthomonas maliensis]KAB7762108.1 hypothetical protein CKY51_22035 [Xanthomonas maliensis]
MKVFGYKEMVLTAPTDLGNGKFRAGLTHRVWFAMEELTDANANFWFDYATQKAGSGSLWKST